MDESLIDLRDHRGRLTRLIAAIVAGIVIAIVVLAGVRSVAVEPNSDPVSGASVGLLAIGLAVVASLVAHGAITSVAHRLRRG